MTTTRKVEPVREGQDATAAEVLAVRGPTVTVAYDGGVHTLPDRGEDFTAFRKAGGTLVGRWSADRLAADLLSRMASAYKLTLWAYLDDEPVAYLVEYTRRTARMPKVEIVGAARYTRT